MDLDDEFDFDDDGLDLLPAHTLPQLETTAIRATQHQGRTNASESDYGLEDGDEVINLDDAAAAPRSSPWVAVDAPKYSRAQQQHDNFASELENGLYDDAMEVE